MDNKEIREYEKKFNFYKEDRFILMGKRLLEEYKTNKESKIQFLNREQMEVLEDDIFTINLVITFLSTLK